MLEIGIQNGGSLTLWAQYFGAATVLVGCDVNPACAELRYDDPRVHVVVGDANSDDTAAQIDEISAGFDLVIDDGSHRSSDIIRSFARYFPKLGDDGLFVAEDLHCSYWTEYEGGLFDPWSSVSFFKRLADILNHEHWGVPHARSEILSSFNDRYGVALSDATLAQIHSVQFLNSICVVRKRPSADNVLGPRVVEGREEVAERLLARSGSVSVPADQGANPWSALPLPEDELVGLRHAKAEQERVLGEQARILDEQARIIREQTPLVSELKRLLDAHARELDKQSRIIPEQALHISQQERLLGEQASALDAQSLIADRLRRTVAVRAGQLQIAQEFSRKLEIRAAAAEAATAALTSRIGEFERHVAALSAGYIAERSAGEARQALLDAVWRSTSWRVSGPIRWVGLQIQRGRRTVGLASRLAARPGGVPRLVRGSIRVLGRYGLSGLRTTLRGYERGVSLPPSPPPLLTVSPGAALHNEDPYEVIARGIFAEQQAELSHETAARVIDGFTHRPLISVLMPVYRTPVQWLRRAIESLQEQYYDDWELCAVDDRSPGSEQRDLLREFAAADPRVRTAVMERNGGISAASNLALQMAQGEFIALLDHDDELTPDALLRMVEAINRQPDADFIYSDECKIDDTPTRRLFHFVFKPDWSPEIMFNCMLTSHLTIYRSTLVEQLGGFRSAYDFSQDYDLALRVSEAARHIVHVERVLYFWRAIPGSAASGDKVDARVSNIGALNAALQRREIPGQATPLHYANCVRIAVPADDTMVSIIIPSDSLQNLRLALQAIRTGTDYANYEVVVVCNGPLAARLADEFDWGALIFAPYDKPYNFSDKCNEGAKAATGDVVVFYNDDVFPLQRDWIERLVEYLWVPGVGGISPKLLHANDTIQYAGMISGTPGLCGTAYNNVPADAPDSFLTMHKYVRNVSILSGACCALRKDVFWQVGGFDADNTPDAHSDLDLSYKVTEAGLRCVYTPHALLRHIGNHSWGAKRRKDRADAFMLRRWGGQLSKDPFFTASMKRVLYRDFSYPYRIFAEHLDPRPPAAGPHVLFVSHELSLTGAPRMLLYAAKVVLQAGGFPVIVAREDGPLRQEITEAGIVTILDASLGQNHFLFERFARNFDLAVVNTIALSAVIRQLSAIENLRTVWWLHEARSLAVDLQKVADVHWARVQVLCNGAYARRFVPEGIDAKVLHYGVPDVQPAEEAPHGPRPMTFLLSGTIEPRKGQDLLVEAIALLPEHVRHGCRFLMTGYLWEMHQEFWREIEGKMARLPEVAYLGLRDHLEQLRLIAKSDVIVCASRDEPWSLVVMEAAMSRKPSIVNECVGAGELFNEDSSFRFECGSALSLAGQLLAAYERRDELPAMGQAARHVFEQELTLDAFGARFMEMVEQQAAIGVQAGQLMRLSRTKAA
ncbi:glycosyltransferase [Lichenicoccus sp.]|uniref:glycosyltransferase n=1 Tax=Lichenicoccus sp. TaxID=2781899 RepID=UPI003D10EF88